MKKNTAKILETLRLANNRIKTDYKARIIGIFGSYARGEQTKNSDLDVLVRFTGKASLFDLVGLADFLELELGMKVDLVSERALRKELKKSILEELVVL